MGQFYSSIWRILLYQQSVHSIKQSDEEEDVSVTRIFLAKLSRVIQMGELDSSISSTSVPKLRSSNKHVPIRSRQRKSKYLMYVICLFLSFHPFAKRNTIKHLAVAVRRTMAHPTAGTTTTGRRRTQLSEPPTELNESARKEIPAFVPAWMRQGLIVLLLTRSNNWSVLMGGVQIYSLLQINFTVHLDILSLDTQ